MKSAVWLLALAGAGAPLGAQAPQFSQLLSFGGDSTGSMPGGALVAYRGQLFGTTVAGGDSTACVNGCGAVYSLTPPAVPGVGWTETVIYSFTGGDDGYFPAAGLTLGSGGVLYGAVQNGGTSGHGAIFALTPPSPGGTWQKAVLHNFAGGDDGSYPLATLVMGNHGELYGATTEGGAGGAGTVFSLTPRGSPAGQWDKRIVYAFAGGVDGANPTQSVTLNHNTGAIYGVTHLGGTDNFGTVFVLAPPETSGPSWTKTALHSFMDQNDGALPNQLLLGNDGVLYGTTAGYSTQGNVYALAPPVSPGGAWTLTVLHAFANDFVDGAFPVAGLTRANGALYGTTSRGGTDENCTCGTAFSLIPPAAPGGSWTYALLYSFVSTNGVAPEAPLLYGDSGVLYGTTADGGSHGDGTVFELKVK